MNPFTPSEAFRLSFEASRHFQASAHWADMEFRLESRWRRLKSLRSRRNRLRLDRANRDQLIAEMEG